MGWLEGIVAVGIVAVVGGIWTHLNGRIAKLDEEKVGANVCDTIQKERVRVIAEVKEILATQADTLVAIQTHLANIDGRLSGSSPQNPGPDPPTPPE